MQPFTIPIPGDTLPRLWLGWASLLAFAFLAHNVRADDDRAAAPNMVIIYCDDLGYGDLGCYGHPTIRTPNLDRMAQEGMKFTQFYSAASVCTPSRAALLTGRLPVRNGMCSDRRRVLFPDSAGGLPQDEVTLAEALKEQGYATACVGKWHLGHLSPYLPTQNGFDSYYGVPYSNDMDRVAGSPPYREQSELARIEHYHVPLMRNEEIIERPADQRTLTRRYTEQAVAFIDSQKEGPFFLYLAHTMPHIPLFRSEAFTDRSLRGIYGDVVEEIDWSVGEILKALREQQLEENTLVFFTSDNGPWLVFDRLGGSAGLLRDGKGTTWEGGMREPAVAWWPGAIPAGSVNTDLACTMDLFTTGILLAGGQVPQDRVIDGVDLRSALLGQDPSPRQSMLYYRGQTLFAARLGPWKAHFRTGNGQVQDPPLLFHLEHDPGEQYNVAQEHTRVLREIERLVEQHQETLEPAPTQLESRI